ncbi:flavodoxin [Gordonibacter sp. An230]|uniref:EFR1 family ferrodoxin n=1 Tax=Gordonibacter sp. An230 TaxID=1965592 RepID=UPI000B391C65|nr:EFR1 family ferrodoxin [Gordonibacter sp. An230]OUO90307.1 flavodoxin [Gordonibacter sp. An230]
MILYFSGTGNSQRAAVQMAERLDDELISVNRLIKDGTTGSFRSDRPWTFVAPTYSWRVPVVMERWMESARFEGSREAYFVLTCGGSVGNAAPYARRLCERIGLRFRGLAGVAMPENYLALGPTPTESECRAIMEKARPRIDELAELVRAGEPFPAKRATLAERLESGPVNVLFYRCFVHDKGFSVSNECISCGRCAARCPLNNIRLEGGRPTWQGTCTHCMACIGGCPTEAIEYKSASRGRHRHYVMDDELCWGSEANSR